MRKLKLIIGIPLLIPLLFIFPVKEGLNNKINNMIMRLEKKTALIPKTEYKYGQNAGEYLCDPKMLVEGPDIDPKIALAGPDIDPGILISPPAGD